MQEMLLFCLSPPLSLCLSHPFTCSRSISLTLSLPFPSASLASSRCSLYPSLPWLAPSLCHSACSLVLFPSSSPSLLSCHHPPTSQAYVCVSCRSLVALCAVCSGLMGFPASVHKAECTDGKDPPSNSKHSFPLLFSIHSSAHPSPPPSASTPLSFPPFLHAPLKVYVTHSLKDAFQ